MMANDDVDLPGSLEELEAAAQPLKKGAALKKQVAQGLPRTIRIVIDDNDAIPPTGLFVGLNGRGYLIRPGVQVDVPAGVVEILENAVMSAPQIDPTTRRVVGYSHRPRFPFHVVRDNPRAA